MDYKKNQQEIRTVGTNMLTPGKAYMTPEGRVFMYSEEEGKGVREYADNGKITFQNTKIPEQVHPLTLEELDEEVGISRNTTQRLIEARRTTLETLTQEKIK